MRQVLLTIPIQYVADVLPDLPFLIYLVTGISLVLLGGALDRMRQQGRFFGVIGSCLGIPIALAGVIKLLAFGMSGIPIYGYGTMLFVAFVICTWLAVRLGRREGISKERVQDLAVWVFISGIIGARVVFMIQYGVPVRQFYELWDGGLVFYGAPLGALVGYGFAYFMFLRKYHVSTWKVADLVAPCVALGLALGRVGCLLNGCCYGNVACTECPAVHFPLCAPPVYTMVKRGHQSPAGFTLDARTPRQIGSVEPGSPAERAGLKKGDRILQVNDKEVASNADLEIYLISKWPRGQSDLQLTVDRKGTQDQGTLTIGPFRPLTLGLNPTQVYESISMVLLLFFLMAYYPLKTRDGSVMVFFMIGYGVHRFLNEMLRTDTEKVAFDLTLSQNVSILVLIGAALLAALVWRRGPHVTTHVPAALPS